MVNHSSHGPNFVSRIDILILFNEFEYLLDYYTEYDFLSLYEEIIT